MLVESLGRDDQEENVEWHTKINYEKNLAKCPQNFNIIHYFPNCDA